MKFSIIKIPCTGTVKEEICSYLLKPCTSRSIVDSFCKLYASCGIVQKEIMPMFHGEVNILYYSPYLAMKTL